MEGPLRPREGHLGQREGRLGPRNGRLWSRESSLRPKSGLSGLESTLSTLERVLSDLQGTLGSKKRGPLEHFWHLKNPTQVGFSKGFTSPLGGAMALPFWLLGGLGGTASGTLEGRDQLPLGCLRPAQSQALLEVNAVADHDFSIH